MAAFNVVWYVLINCHGYLIFERLQLNNCMARVPRSINISAKQQQPHIQMLLSFNFTPYVDKHWLVCLNHYDYRIITLEAAPFFVVDTTQSPPININAPYSDGTTVCAPGSLAASICHKGINLAQIQIKAYCVLQPSFPSSPEIQNGALPFNQAQSCSFDSMSSYHEQSQRL
jgi:hypothetical protein